MVVNGDMAVGTWTEGVAGGASLVLNSDGTVIAFDRCNTLGGAWVVANGNIIIRMDGGTERSCDGLDTWLGAVASVTVEHDSLLIANAAGDTIGTLTKR